MAVKRITKRWLYNSFLVILIVLSSVIIGFSITIRNYYYNSVLQTLKTTASIVNANLNNYSEDNSADYSSNVRRLVEDFEERDHMELMALDKNGAVIITSSGFSPPAQVMPDFEMATVSSMRDGENTGTLNGEHILAYTLLAPQVDDSNLSAMRYVVSLKAINRQIIVCIAAAGLVGAIIIFFVVLSSSYFISSIVNPVDQVGKIAGRIAKGDFSVRLSKKYDDEIGELCDVINSMAEELQENEKMKNDFISSVSHELRTPLTAIKGWAETLNSVGVDEQTTHKGMGVIIKETERLSGMVEELLDFSRIQSGRFKLTMSKLDLVAELSDAVLMFTERAKRENIELIYDEPLDIFPIVGDANRLRQVFINIIDNALKYSDHSDSVNVIANIRQNDILIIVKDTGCGISADDLPKVKTKFYKANSTRRGSGIGLAVADEIVNMHGGSLAIDSIENVGTTVTIILPISK